MFSLLCFNRVWFFQRVPKTILFRRPNNHSRNQSLTSHIYIHMHICLYICIFIYIYIYIYIYIRGAAVILSRFSRDKLSSAVYELFCEVHLQIFKTCQFVVSKFFAMNFNCRRYLRFQFFGFPNLCIIFLAGLLYRYR